MIGRTLGVYFAGNFLRNTISVFILFFALIVVIDMIELARSLSKQNNEINFFHLFRVSFYRAPAFAENIFPFAVLFGASLSLLMLNRRLELVIARASGMSVWQFLFPLILAAIFLGIFATVIYNPLALKGTVASKAAEAELFGKAKGSFSGKSTNFWLRVNETEGQTVLQAAVSQGHGTKLTAVTAYRFGADGLLKERIDAASADFISKDENSFYVLKNAHVTVVGAPPQTKESITIPVRITRSELQARQMKVEDHSIWQLPDQMEKARRSGKNVLPFTTRVYSLAAQPILFVAMVLLAGTISLTFARFGQNKKMILGGILAGFVLYILTKLVITFGSNGLVPPFLATWSPALVAILISLTVLLYQEDG